MMSRVGMQDDTEVVDLSGGVYVIDMMDLT